MCHWKGLCFEQHLRGDSTDHASITNGTRSHWSCGSAALQMQAKSWSRCLGGVRSRAEQFGLMEHLQRWNLYEFKFPNRQSSNPWGRPLIPQIKKTPGGVTGLQIHKICKSILGEWRVCKSKKFANPSWGSDGFSRKPITLIFANLENLQNHRPRINHTLAPPPLYGIVTGFLENPSRNHRFWSWPITLVALRPQA